MRNNRHLNKSSVVDSRISVSPSSPLAMGIGARQRRSLNKSVIMTSQQRHDGTPEKRRVANTSVIGGSGPLLSSPFMPQIKRALGLEPNLKQKYGEPRRHSYNLTSLTVTSPSLPHVKLNRTQRLSLTEKNTSMMNRSSTVKIAPPVMGKVASPSLYHLRCNTSSIESRGTPDTYAVISALKDRRKRSVTVMEEAAETNTQQAKRRRQESQHSNASTSSMPSMPDHFPELTGADFSMRLETPGIKRPSRPSQADDEDWNQGDELKRQKCLNKNNSILSSLSSSQRFIQHQKRKTDSSFTEKVNTSGYGMKLPRGEPPRLTHLDVTIDTASSRTMPVSTSTSTDHSICESIAAVSKDKDRQTQESHDSAESSPTVTKLPSMKKTASIYAGLGSPASFKKVQYANVVATLDDYDSDREVEQQRVKQMLKDLDDSFNTKQAKTEETKKTETSLATSTMASIVTTSVAIATTATVTTTSTTSVLSALEKLSKSPVQETGAPGVNSVLASTKPAATVKLALSQSGGTMLAGSFGAPGAGSLSTAVSSAPSVSATADSTGSSMSAPGGFTLNTSKPIQSLSALLSTTTSTAVTVSSLGNAAPGQTVDAGGFNFGSVVSAAPASTPASGSTNQMPAFGSTNQTPAFGSTNQPPVYGSASQTPAFGSTNQLPAFGSTNQTPAFGSTSQPPAYGSTSQPPAFGSTNQTPASTPMTSLTPSVLGSNPTAVVGFNFGSQGLGATGAAVSSCSVTPGFSFGTSTALSTTGGLFTSGLSTAAPTTSSVTGFNVASATSTGGFPFGLSTGVSTAASHPTTQTAMMSGFSFGAVTNSGSSSNAMQNTAAPTASQITSAQGATGTPFNFGGQSSTSAGPTFSFNTGTAAFGAKTTQQSSAAISANQTPAFGSTNQTPAFGTTNQAPAFGSTNQAPAFGSANPAPAFGSANPAPAFGSANPAPAFGSANPAPAFGSANQASAFGSANPAPAFGSANPAPAFGSANPAPAFGTTNQTPAFGSTNQTPAFGSTNQAPAFGSANPAPAFGSANPAPAFGTTNQTAAFGSTNPAPAFGSTNPAPAFGSTNPAPAFGSTGQAFGAATTQKSNTPVFGSTANSSTGSAFGSTTGFGKSQSMPVFGTPGNDNSNNANTFNFGAPAPNVNPFGQGQTTPAKQTGSAFGQVATDSTPKAQTGALFQFGQSSNTSTAAKGFDFSNSGGAGSSNTGGFNFMASSSVPVFNFGTSDTPTVTPGFGAPGATPGFSLGAGDTAPRTNRPKARGRRTARK